MTDKISLKRKLRIFWICVSITVTIITAVFSGREIVISCLKSAYTIMLAICIGSAVMAVMEYFSLFRKVSYLARPLIRFSRLPEVAGTAFSVALLSRTTANAMLADSYRNGNINRKEMIMGAMTSSYPSMAVNYFQIMFPVIAAVGLAGIIYFSIVNLIGIFITVVILCFSRWYLGGNIATAQNEPENERPPLRTVMVNFRKRTVMLISRIIFITVPLYMLTALAVRKGLFTFLQQYFPESIKSSFSPEIMTVAFTRMGSIFAAAGAASELMSRNQIQMWGIVIAFLLGNLLSMPVRFLRKTLPAHAGIFPGYDGVIIASGMQAMRFVFIITAMIMIFPFLK